MSPRASPFRLVSTLLLGVAPSACNTTAATADAALDAMADAALDATADAAPLDCPVERSSAAIDLNAHPDGAGFRFVGDTATAPKWDTVLALRARCDDAAALACNDDAAFPPLSQISAPLEAGEVVFVVLDGRANGAAPGRGSYVLTVTPR